MQQLSVWSLRSHAEYRAELERRTGIAAAIGAARWFAERLDLDEGALEAAGAEAEAVVRMGLLWHWMHPAAEAWPHAVSFEKRLSAMRRKGIPAPSRLPLPAGMPAGVAAVADGHVAAVLADAARILDAATAPRALLRPMGSFRARYFLEDDPLAEVDDYHQGLDALLEAGDDADAESAPAPASRTWERLTQGHEDEHSLLTLFLCLAAGVPRKTVLTEKAAASLVRRVRRHGWQPELAEGVHPRACGQRAPGQLPRALEVLRGRVGRHAAQPPGRAPGRGARAAAPRMPRGGRRGLNTTAVPPRPGRPHGLQQWLYPIRFATGNRAADRLAVPEEKKPPRRCQGGSSSARGPRWHQRSPNCAWVTVGRWLRMKFWITLHGSRNGRCVIVIVQVWPLTMKVPATVPSGVPTENAPPLGPPVIVPPWSWIMVAILTNRSWALPVKSTLKGGQDAMVVLPLGCGSVPGFSRRRTRSR